MAFDYSKLRGRIIEKYGSQTAFVKSFGTSENTFSMKMNNKVRLHRMTLLKFRRC